MTYKISNYLPKIHFPSFRTPISQACSKLQTSSNNFFQKALNGVSGYLRSTKEQFFNAAVLKKYLTQAYSKLPSFPNINGSAFKKYLSTAYSKLPGYSRLPGIDARDKLSRASSFLWVHKTPVLAGAAVSALAYLIIDFIRNAPEYPFAKLESSLNDAKITIGMKEVAAIPPKATLTFCIDTSTSMSGDRENQVKKAVNNVLSSALNIANTVKDSMIKIVLIEFNTDAQLISQPVEISKDSISKISHDLNGYISSGGTDILTGLDFATQQLEEMAKRDPLSVHTLILLTDGENELDNGTLKSIHRRLAAVHARLFGIGIGKEHSKSTLRKITDSKRKFQSEYIDTSDGSNTIESAIANIYEQTVAAFSNLTLKSSQLEARAWSVDGEYSSQNQDGYSEIVLGSISSGQELVKSIQLNKAEFRTPFDLSTLTFELSFTDPRSRKGSMTLRWSPNTMISPDIIRFSSNKRFGKWPK